MELEEAKKNIKIFTESPINCDNCRYCSGKRVTKEAIEVILKELDKKDKVIDEIAKDVGINSNYKKLIGRTVEERTEIVKDMYYKKVEEQEQ